MLENLFEGQSVDVSEDVREDVEENTVVLVKDGEIVAQSPLKALNDAILMVNSDLYSTGTIGLDEVTVPDVVDGLAGSRFRLRGYPESNSEKLVLILISRHIEQLAHQAGEGTIRSSFQKLSRIVDEKGTRRVYETLADSPVDVHVYGQPDRMPPVEFSVTAHGGYKDNFRDSWFVVYTPEETQKYAALVAIEVEPRTWEGFWTYEESLVSAIADDIKMRL